MITHNKYLLWVLLIGLLLTKYPLYAQENSAAKGFEYMGRSKWTLAEKEFTKAILLGPEAHVQLKDCYYALNYGARGRCWYELKQFDKAIEDLKKAKEYSCPEIPNKQHELLEQAEKELAINIRRGMAKGKIEYENYINKDRGYQIDYPAQWLMGERTANNDGRKFTSIDNQSEIIVYSHVSLGEGISYGEKFINNIDIRNEIDDISSYVTISYKSIKPTWFVVSGIKKSNSKIYYQKTYFSQKHDEYRTFIIEYPIINKKDYDQILKQIVKSFKDL